MIEHVLNMYNGKQGGVPRFRYSRTTSVVWLYFLFSVFVSHSQLLYGEVFADAPGMFLTLTTEALSIFSICVPQSTLVW